MREQDGHQQQADQGQLEADVDRQPDPVASLDQQLKVPINSFDRIHRPTTNLAAHVSHRLRPSGLIGSPLVTQSAAALSLKWPRMVQRGAAVPVGVRPVGSMLTFGSKCRRNPQLVPPSASTKLWLMLSQTSQSARRLPGMLLQACVRRDRRPEGGELDGMRAVAAQPDDRAHRDHPVDSRILALACVSLNPRVRCGPTGHPANRDRQSLEVGIRFEPDLIPVEPVGGDRPVQDEEALPAWTRFGEPRRR